MPEQRLPRTQCVECLLKWLLPPLPTISAVQSSTASFALRGCNLFSYLSTNRLTYFFDPQAMLTLGSLARTTVVA